MKPHYLLLFLLISTMLRAAESTYAWGLGSAFRSATIPYATSQNDPLLNGYLLLPYLDTPYFYLDGTEGGLRLYSDAHWEFGAYGTVHFVDVPRHDTNYFSDDTADLGASLSYKTPDWRADLQLMSDPAWRPYAALRLRAPMQLGAWHLEPWTALRYKSSEFNRYYFGMDIENVSADIGADVGLKSRWDVAEDFSLIGEANLRYLGDEVARASTIETPMQAEVFLGAGIFQNAEPSKKRWEPSGYFRFAFGEATPSSFSENVTGEGARDLHRIYMLSVFYGLPLSKSLFGAPIHSYFSPGFAHHFARDGHQGTAQEYILAYKMYYRPESWWLRFGFGTGISYITEPTYIEKYIQAKDGYDHTSHYMQNLDFSFDFELRHLFGNAFRALWFGYALHHRSGVFESGHQYGQIKGGSNYNTLYVQYHFEE